MVIVLHRCLSVLADKISQTAAMDDKRIRKELQVRMTFMLSAEMTSFYILTSGNLWEIA